MYISAPPPKQLLIIPDFKLTIQFLIHWIR